jgi:type IV pilus assembly protein PilO
MKDFYAEKPIALKMLGTYHQFGTFISNVASLPRVVILTMHDVSLRPTKVKGSKISSPSGQLSLEGTVKTYRYLDDAEAAEVEQAAAAKKTPAGKKKPPAKPAKGGE